MTEHPETAIVLPTDGIGGTEKRLAELWVHLRRHQTSRHLLVVSSPLLEALRAIRDYRAELEKHRGDVVVHAPSGSARRTAVRRLRADGRAKVFHVAMAAPLLLGLTRPTPIVFTVPLVTLDMLNPRGQLSVVVGAALSSQVDVLDPRVTDVLRAKLPWMADRIHNTPGSQIDLDVWQPVPFARKENVIVFCGLLSKAKQAGRLLDVLPELHARLVAGGVRHVRYLLMGRDTPEVKAYQRVEALSRTVPVKAWFESNPASELRKAKVFLSLQTVTNYPSKSLLEAMACGALPVITDVGESRRAALPEFSEFVPEAFTAEHLAEACLRFLRLPAAQGEAAVARARAFLAERFSIQASTRYFEDLYSRAYAHEA